MPNPPSNGSPYYENVETVLLMARTLVNDTFAGATQTAGEGRVFTDSAPFIIPLYNNAVKHLQRDLENRGFPAQQAEAVITGLTPINGANGLGVGDPAAQVRLGFDGYFDGSTLNAAIALPAGLITPQRVYERVGTSTNVFNEIFEAQAGLQSRMQNASLGQWEWRGDSLYFNGSTQTMDVRLRYYAATGLLATNANPNTFPTTSLPWLDSAEALAYRMAFEFCQARVPPGAANDLQAGYRVAMLGLAARYVRRAQRVQYRRSEFGTAGGGFGWN